MKQSQYADFLENNIVRLEGLLMHSGRQARVEALRKPFADEQRAWNDVEFIVRGEDLE